MTDHPEAVSFATRATIEEFAGDGVRWSYCFCPYLWDKAWVKPQGFVVKVFPRKVSKYTQECSPGRSLKALKRFSGDKPEAFRLLL